jgi:predicted permease
MSPGRRFYVCLLRLLPADFRASRGSELLATFDDMRSELGPRPGALRLGGFYVRLTIDLLRRIRPERARAARRYWEGPASPADPSPRLRGLGPSHAFDRLRRDIRVAVRSLARRPVFLLVATLSLAIGIGANTAIFSVVNAVFIRQYPYRAPQDLVRIYTHVPNRSVYGTTSYPNYRDISDFDAAFQAVGAYKTIFSRMELQDETLRVVGEGVSHTLLPMLGVEAALGRTFLAEEDDTPGAHLVMMLGHGFWQRVFGEDREIVGTTIRLGGQSFTVVGVTPEGFHGLSGPGVSADFFVPLVMHGVITGFTNHSHFENRLDRRYYVVGRIAEGMALESVRARLDVLSRQIQEANPQINQDWSFPVLSMQDVALAPEIDRAVLPFVVLLMTAGGLVLLLACTNLASFLLARGVDRRREIALRLALGAGRGALVRQLLTETVLLALLGGASGLLVAQATLGLLIRVQPSLPVPITLELGLDRTVLLFTFGLSTLAGLLFGMAPALQSTNPDVVPTLKDELGLARHRRFGLRNALVAFQMALSVVLLVGGGLFIRSLGAARYADLGFSTRDAGIAWVDLSISGVPAAEYPAVREELTLRARALPGIEAATSASHIPLDIVFTASGRFYTIDGVDPPGQGAGHNVQRAEVDPAFFQAMGIPLAMGRGFTDEDRPESPRVAVVNETAARRFWPAESPVGREFSPVGSDQVIRVVGVAGDTRIERLREPPKPLFYFPLAQRPDPDIILVARGQPAPEEITAMLRRMIRETDPSLTIMDAKTMEEHVGVILFPARMAALLLGVFGGLALTLATIGLYGVVSFSVSQRTQEMGIRLSLGADSGAVRSMVIRSAMGLAGIGGVAGLAAALGLAQLIRHLLYGVGPWDPMTILGVPLLLGGVAAAAALIPARRASRVNPVEALRYE